LAAKEEEKEDPTHLQNLKIVDLERSKNEMVQSKAIVHTYFICKEAGADINWKKPLI